MTRAVSYMGIDRDAGTAVWSRIDTFGGKWAENITQAVARDILWHGLELAEADTGLEVVGDVYDELLCLADINDSTTLERLIGYMTSKPDWLDDSFYLSADGYTSERYKKD